MAATPTESLYARIYSLYQDRENSSDFELPIPQTPPSNPILYERNPVHKMILATGFPLLKYIDSKTALNLTSIAISEVVQTWEIVTFLQF